VGHLFRDRGEPRNHGVYRLIQARLQLVPPHDPQFRRNRERVVRDAERENILLDWDLGLPED